MTTVNMGILIKYVTLIMGWKMHPAHGYETSYLVSCDIIRVRNRQERWIDALLTRAVTYGRGLLVFELYWERQTCAIRARIAWPQKPWRQSGITSQSWRIMFIVCDADKLGQIAMGNYWDYFIRTLFVERTRVIVRTASRKMSFSLPCDLIVS